MKEEFGVQSAPKDLETKDTPSGNGAAKGGTIHREHPKAKPKAKSRDKGRKPGPRSYPVMTFEEALILGQGIMDHGAGHPTKRATLLSKLKLPNNNATKNLITNSGKYEITQGNHSAEELRLTEIGRLAVDPSASSKQRLKARFDLAIRGIEEFNKLYERFKSGKTPAPEVMRDYLVNIDQGDRAQCVDIFLSNAKFVGLLETREGAPYLLSVEELLAKSPGELAPGASRQIAVIDSTGDAKTEDFTKVCFFIAPIGQDGSEQRKHSNAILSSYVERALETISPDLKVVRADKIDKPGMISAHVIEYLLRAKLVVADLSYHNPNVFYELSLRHATGKPVVHLIRANDHIPFDIGNFRTVKIKFEDRFDILAELDSTRAEIANQMRQALNDGVSTDNPILTFCPKGRFVENGVT